MKLKTRPRPGLVCRLTAAAFGASVLVASSEHIYNQTALIPSAFTKGD